MQRSHRLGPLFSYSIATEAGAAGNADCAGRRGLLNRLPLDETSLKYPPAISLFHNRRRKTFPDYFHLKIKSAVPWLVATGLKGY
jgi:hypothetical protein